MTYDLRATELYFGGLAVEWDRKMVIDPAAGKRLNAALDHLDIRPGQRVIDAGCGTGVLHPFLARRIGRRGRVAAVDLAAEMIGQARIKHGRDRRFSWVAGEIAQVLEGLKPGSVDRIVCFSAFPHFADQRRVLGAFHRVLRAGVPPARASRAGSAGRRGGRFAIIHLQDSEKLNRFHAGLENTPVCRHVLPPAAEVAAVASDIGFAVLEAREAEGLYLVVAER